MMRKADKGLRNPRKVVPILLFMGMFGYILWPSPWECTQPVAKEISPDGAFVLTLCRQLILPMAMPGQSGDAPGVWALRDREGWLIAVAGLEMIQEDQPAEWHETYLQKKLALQLDLPEPSRSLFAKIYHSFLVRLEWKFGLAPHSYEFR